MFETTSSPQSCEALFDVQYKKGPNLCTELEKIFQEVIDYKASLNETNNAKRVRLVVSYFKEKAGPKVLEVIKKYTGLKLKLELFRTFTCNFAVVWHFSDKLTYNDWLAIMAASARYSGQISNQEYEKYRKMIKNIKSQEELEKFSREVLKEKGAVTKAMHEKHDLNGSLYFCPYTAFLVEETYEKYVEPLTAKEIAAIIGHECGHVIAFCCHMTDIYYKKDILYNASKHYFMTAPEDSKRRMSLSTVKRLFPEVTKKIMDKLEDYKKKHSAKDSKFVAQIIYTVLILVIRIFCIPGFIIQTALLNIFNTFLFGPIEHFSSYCADKKGDIDINHNILHGENIGGYYDEELADEFVSKFGYTASLTSGLDKLYKWGRYTGGYTNVKGISLYTHLLPWLAATLFTGYGEDFIHPDMFKREENAIMDLIKAFKAANCPQEVLDEYYKAYQDIKKLHDTKTFDRRWMIANKAVSRMFDYIIETPYELLYSSRFRQEYENLYRQTQQLMNNQIYALSYGLKQMGEEKK